MESDLVMVLERDQTVAEPVKVAVFPDLVTDFVVVPVPVRVAVPVRV